MEIEYIDEVAPTFDDWVNSYGMCSECEIDVVLYDKGTWLDDNCHRHQFQGVLT